jgi:hypothetical protein
MRPVSAKFDQAIEVFNRGEYIAAAEAFENLLAETEGDLKELIAALNRIATALHLRLERSGRQAAVNLLSQAMLELDEMKPDRGGIDVERLFQEIAAYTEEIRATPKKDARSGVKHRARLFLERRRAPRIERTR